ncbi:hypothetical protein [Neisseria meningitidis]|nr:hypothetical protein [Neisseria meningitidis]
MTIGRAVAVSSAKTQNIALGASSISRDSSSRFGRNGGSVHCLESRA